MANYMVIINFSNVVMYLNFIFLRIQSVYKSTQYGKIKNGLSFSSLCVCVLLFFF